MSEIIIGIFLIILGCFCGGNGIYFIIEKDKSWIPAVLSGILAIVFGIYMINCGATVVEYCPTCGQMIK